MQVLAAQTIYRILPHVEMSYRKLWQESNFANLYP
jgi:hypothetical protein